MSRRRPTAAFTAVARRLRRALRTYGVVGTARQAWAGLRSARRTHAALQAERAFDRRFNVDTAGIVRLESLAIAANRELGVRYQGSDPDVVRRVIADLGVAYEDFVFVDYGSGKGRVILVASEFPFRRIVGVEFSPELHEVAVRNVATYTNPARRSPAIEPVCADAAAFDPPDDPLVLYFYNPFLEPLMRTVLERIAGSLRARPRPAVLVYTGAVPMAAAIEAAGFVRAPSTVLSGTDGVFRWPRDGEEAPRGG